MLVPQSHPAWDAAQGAQPPESAGLTGAHAAPSSACRAVDVPMVQSQQGTGGISPAAAGGRGCTAGAPASHPGNAGLRGGTRSSPEHTPPAMGSSIRAEVHTAKKAITRSTHSICTSWTDLVVRWPASQLPLKCCHGGTRQKAKLPSISSGTKSSKIVLGSHHPHKTSGNDLTCRLAAQPLRSDCL